MRTRLLSALTVTLVLVVVGGCGGSSEDEASVEESTAERTTEATTEETTTREKTAAKEGTAKEKASKEKAPKEKAAKEKNTAKQKTKESAKGGTSSSQQQEGAVSGSSSVKSTETSASDESQEGASVVDIYSPEVASVDEPVPSPPSEAQDSPPSPDYRTPSQKAGFNEAGQDVSNTPVISPEENAARLPCLRAYYESLPEDQRGPESQRVTAEANAQGVTPFDIVGC